MRAASDVHAKHASVQMYSYRCICGALIRRLPCQADDDNWTGAAGKGFRSRMLRHISCTHVALVPSVLIASFRVADNCRLYYLYSISFSPHVIVKLNPFSWIYDGLNSSRTGDVETWGSLSLSLSSKREVKRDSNAFLYAFSCISAKRQRGAFDAYKHFPDANIQISLFMIILYTIDEHAHFTLYAVSAMPNILFYENVKTDRVSATCILIGIRLWEIA